MSKEIRIEHLSKTYVNGDVKVEALKDCSLEFETGKMTAIIGASGSGKSTLLQLLGGLMPATSGQIFFGEKDILQLTDVELAEFRCRDVGFVFQFFNLIPELTVRENIEVPIQIGKMPMDGKYLEQLVETLGIGECMERYPNQISGGQQQRVAIARALVKKPQVILCDEPTGNLDTHNGQMVLGLLRQLQKEYGQTIILVTHDMYIAGLADKVVRIEDGEIIV